MPHELSGTLPISLPPEAVPCLAAGFFAVSTVIATILFHLVAARVFTAAWRKGRTGPVVFGLLSLLLGLSCAVFGITVATPSLAVLTGLGAGFLIWLALGEVGQEMGWVSLMSRSAVPLFLLCTALWLACFLVDPPKALLAAAGYPVWVWGVNLTRVRVFSKWGPFSLAATVLALVTASVAGAGLVLGILLGSPVTGILGGMLFADSTWSVLEMLWERGTAKRPWRQGSGDQKIR